MSKETTTTTPSCPICGKSFPGGYGLESHVMTECDTSTECPHLSFCKYTGECEDCGVEVWVAEGYRCIEDWQKDGEDAADEAMAERRFGR